MRFFKAFLDPMIDTGFWILDIKKEDPYFIQHQASGIRHLCILLHKN